MIAHAWNAPALTDLTSSPAPSVTCPRSQGSILFVLRYRPSQLLACWYARWSACLPPWAAWHATLVTPRMKHATGRTTS